MDIKNNPVFSNDLVFKKIVLAAVAIVILGIGLISGYKYGDGAGFARGYQQAEVDAKKLQEEAAKKVVNETSKAANPFQVANPLEGVEANPFEKTKKILNPFE